MNADEQIAFFDTNILVYALVEQEPKTLRAFLLVEAGGLVSVQVLNELVNVCRRRFQTPWEDLDRLLRAVYSLCGPVQSMTEAVHLRAVKIAQTHRYGIYDATIIASALLAGCTILYTEDMQDGQQIENLTIRSPFTAPA